MATKREAMTEGGELKGVGWHRRGREAKKREGWPRRRMGG